MRFWRSCEYFNERLSAPFSIYDSAYLILTNPKASADFRLRYPLLLQRKHGGKFFVGYFNAPVIVAYREAIFIRGVFDVLG